MTTPSSPGWETGRGATSRPRLHREQPQSPVRVAETAAGAAGPGGVAIACDNLVKIYKVADLEVVALQGLDLSVDPGELIAVVGASGSGKSTLLNILGGVDSPTAGTARVGSFDLNRLTERDRTAYRRDVIGFIWQQTAHNLLPYLSIRDNVELPMVLAGVSRRQRRERATELLELVGIGVRARHMPDQMSGGEQQRAAVAVALANEPQVLLADEPTGELDTATAAELFTVFRAAASQLGVTTVILTHDAGVSEEVSRMVLIRDGRTSAETLREGEHGNVTAEELAVLDRSGRLQLPADYVEQLALERRVRLSLEDDHIGVWPDRRRRTS